MDNQTQKAVFFSSPLEELEKSFSEGQPDISKFKETWRLLTDARSKMQQLTEYGAAIHSGNAEWLRLLNEMRTDNLADLMDKLQKIGFALKKKAELRKAFESAGFRLLEQTRSGKKDAVNYGILRIFIAQKQDIPRQLVTAFKYHGEDFKILIFSFLSGILGKEEIV